jgi:hypothetical protein
VARRVASKAAPALAGKVTPRYCAMDGEWREGSPFRRSAVVIGAVMSAEMVGQEHAGVRLQRRCSGLMRNKTG